GVVDMDLPTGQAHVHVTGYAGSQAVFIDGSWKGDDQQVDGDFTIRAKDIPLDEKIISALPDGGDKVPNFRKLARSFNASGKADIIAHVRQGPGNKDFRNEYHAIFHDTAIRWDLFPYPLEKVSGLLDIYPKHWVFTEGRGEHRGGEVLVKGGSLTRE